MWGSSILKQLPLFRPKVPAASVPCVLAILFCTWPAKTYAQASDALPGQIGFENQSAPVPAWAAEEKLLRALLDQERVLLVDYGPDYYQVQDLRARIRTVRDVIAQKRAEDSQRARTTGAHLVACAAAPSTAITVPPAPADFTAPSFHASSFQNKGEPSSAPGLAIAAGGQLVAVKPWADNPPTKYPPAVSSSSEGEEMEAPVPTASRRPAQANRIASEGESTASPRQAPVEAQPALEHLTLAYLVAVLVGLVLGLVIHFFAALWLIRYFGCNLARFLSSEVGTRFASPTISHGDLAAVGADPVDTPPPQVFDIGPTYEEELIAKNKAKEQSDGALLMELFQQNLQMREQMNALETTAD